MLTLLWLWACGASGPDVRYEPVLTLTEGADPWTCPGAGEACDADPWCEGALWLADGLYQCPEGGVFRACAQPPTLQAPAVPMFGSDAACAADCGPREPCFDETVTSCPSVIGPTCGVACCSDADCGSWSACVAVDGLARCLSSGDCRVDSDCASGRCRFDPNAPSQGSLRCDPIEPECVTDEDCAAAVRDPIEDTYWCHPSGRCAVHYLNCE